MNTIRFASLGLFGLLLVAGEWQLTRAGAQTPAAGNLADGAGQFWSKSQSLARSQGNLSYADRPQNVQVVLQRMYDNNKNYRTFSALFVNHEFGKDEGSVRIDIAQPDTVRTTAFATDSGTGGPVEETSSQGNGTLVYAPSANVSMLNPMEPVAALMPLEQVPLSVLQRDHSATSIYGMHAFQGILANAFVHPAEIVTGPIFTTKVVSIMDESVFEGRSAWVLHGRQATGAPVEAQRGNAWNMWVDKQSGIILRMEFLSGARMIGWAEMHNAVIDWKGAGASTAQATIHSLVLPPGVKRVSGEEYGMQVVGLAQRR